MAKKVSADADVAYLQADHPGATDGAGFYEVTKDNTHKAEYDDDGNSISVTFTNSEVKFGKRLEWVKNTPDKPGKPANADNNEGHYVYADSVKEGDE